MSFGEAVRVCFAKYVDFSGRAGRPEFWWFVLFQLIVSVAAGLIDLLLTTQFVGAITGLALVLPGLTVTVRRLHDSERSGAWLLGPIGVTIAAGVMGLAGVAGLVVVLLCVALAFELVIVFWTLLKGSEGANAYGPAPA